MPLLHPIALLGALVLLDVPVLLQEPDYAVASDGDRWVVQKPRPGVRQPFAISEHRDRSAAELRRKTLPRLRFAGLFVRFDPVTFARAVIADWTAQEDAQDIQADIRGILNRFAPAGSPALLQSTPLYMARLFGATGHTAEETADHTRFVIYLDPFRATGRLHAAATLIHELAHVERFRARGFHTNRAAGVLPKRDFVLLGLADELAAYQAEAGMVRSFLDSQANGEARRASGDAMRKPELGWPVALTVMLGFEGPPDAARRILEARRQVILDLERIAGSYWDSRRTDPLDPLLRQRIRNWYQGSREWNEIAAERPEWRKAEELRRSDSAP
jgi:hypothetical protein